MSHGRGLRALLLQQLLRLLRARLPARSRRRSRHRTLKQRWLRRSSFGGLCGIHSFVKFCQLFERMFAARAVDADKCVSPHLFRSTRPVLVIGEARRLDDACPLRPHQRTRRGSVSAFLPLVRKVRICSTKTVSSSCNVSVGVPPVNSAKSWTICIWS